MDLRKRYHELEYPVPEGETYEDAVTGDTVTIEHERTHEKVPLDGIPMWIVLTYDREVELVDEWDEGHSAPPFEVRLMNGHLHEQRPIATEGVPTAMLEDYQFFENRTSGEKILGATVPNPGEYIENSDIDYVVDWNQYHVAYEAYGNICIEPTSTFLLRRALMPPETYLSLLGWSRDD